MDWLIYVVIFLIISGFIFERIVKKRSAKEPKNSLSLEKLNDDKIEKNPIEDKATEPDPHYALKSSSIKLKKASNDYLKSVGGLLEQKFSEKWQNDIDEIENRKKMAENLELPTKLFDLYDKLKSYAYITKNDRKYRCESLGYIKIVKNIEEETNGKKIKYDNVISFGFKTKEYTFKENPRYADFDEYVSEKKIELFGNDKIKIFSENYYLDLEKNYDNEKWSPSPMGVKSFIPGEWISDLLELYEKLVALLKEREIKEKYKHKIRNIKKQKKDFGLQ